MAELKSPDTHSWPTLIRNWWQFILIGLVLSSVGVGLTYILYLVFLRLQKAYLSWRTKPKAVPSSVKAHLTNAHLELYPYQIEKTSRKPGSYGVYLGSLDNPPTDDQIQILAEWDLLVCDPLQPGITKAITSGKYHISEQVIARLDVGAVVGTFHNGLASVIEWVSMLVKASSKTGQHRFTGVIISNWESDFTTPWLKEIIAFQSSLGLAIYLEISTPTYLTDTSLAELDDVTGLIIRNATISSNGEERDAFQMAEDLRPTIKAFVTQACLRSFVVLVWETLDDGVVPINAVIKRCYQWSRFYSAVPWIGSTAALSSAKLSLQQKEPMGGFDWLKELQVMKVHDTWRMNRDISPRYFPENHHALSQLDSILGTSSESPEQASLHDSEESPSPNSSFSRSTTPTGSRSSISIGTLSWLSLLDGKSTNSISCSPDGKSYDYLGCFPLGLIVTRRCFADVVQSQSRFREMILLDEIKEPKLNEIGSKLQEFCNALSNGDIRQYSDWGAAMQELAQQLCRQIANNGNSIKTYVGLDSGFQIQPGMRLWGVYELDEEGILHIYTSRNVSDLAGTILHTFLSSRGCPRHECFQAEIMFSEWTRKVPSHSSGLPPRLLNDIALLSPVECLTFLQNLNLTPVTGNTTIINLLRLACENQLLESTDYSQLKEMSTSGYLSGRASAHDLINARINWYRQSNIAHPRTSAAIDNFLQVDSAITQMLKYRDIISLAKLTESLSDMIEVGRIDAQVDLLALSVFCAMRKHSFDEAYMEVTDRNTLFNDQSDQAAAFAELFATGARCEAYFDLTPSAFGKLLYDRYRAYHHRIGHEPPLWTDSNPTTPSAYAAAKIDVDPTLKKSKMSAGTRFTFLSVFAIPALLDILMLTFTNKGLYLSGFMGQSTREAATLALMISLLISGAVGTWITCGGSYYLISMVFSAMNMFCLTRLAGGLALSFAIGFIGLTVVGAQKGITYGIVFFLYLIALTMYLCLLATLANFSYPGSAFQSGRPYILLAIPLLFISPIISILVPGHDIFIYITVLYIFVTILALAVRRVGSKWTTWYLKIEKISDQNLREWYIETHEDGNEKAVLDLTEPGVLKLAREALIKDVTKARRWFGYRSNDPVVLKLAKSYDATIFLMEWYSGYSGTPLPVPFSSTWNMQTKVALQTLKQLQTGLRLHNAFIHWRQAGDEIGCSILYFIVALIDKWTILLRGGSTLGVLTSEQIPSIPAQTTTAATPTVTEKPVLSVGFALAYYLIGAVLLDVNASKLHTMTARGRNMLITNVDNIPEAVRREVGARRYLYWKMLGRYMLFHVWSLAIATALLWELDVRKKSMILFLCYVGAYTGLLWYQYTKIFSGPRSLKPLIAAVLVGLPVGQLMKRFFPTFSYDEVITLAASTWTAGFLSLYYARIRTKSKYKESKSKEDCSMLKPEGFYHGFSNPGKDPLLSQDELRIIYQNLKALRDEEKYQIDPQSHPGLEIKSALLHALAEYRDPHGVLSRFASEAFPEAAELLDLAVFALERGTVVVDCISQKAMTDSFPGLKAISYNVAGKLQIIIGCEMVNIQDQQSSISSFCQTTAELILHAVAECFLGFTHDNASLAECLLTPRAQSHGSRYSPVPSRVKNYLMITNCSNSQAKSLAAFCEQQTLRHLSLGLDPDVDWDRLPRDIRELLIRRCTGQNEMLTPSQKEWLVFNQTHGVPISTYITRCNFGAFVAMSSRNYALGAREEQSDEKFYHKDALDSFDFLRLKPPISKFTARNLLRTLRVPFSLTYHNIGTFLKLLAVALVAEPEFQRELDYALHTTSLVTRQIVLFFATGTWKYAKFVQNLVLPAFMFHGRKNIAILWKRVGGTTVTVKRQRIAMENADGLSTAFIHSPYGSAGTFKVRQYAGDLDREPDDNWKLQRISTYRKDMLLLRREDYSNGNKVNVYQYEYLTRNQNANRKRLSKINNPRYPMLRRCIEGKSEAEEVNFSYRGLVQSGSYILHGSLVRFNCHYRQDSDYDDALLRAEYVLPHLTCTVSWSAPPKSHQEKLDKWIPHSQVTEATFVLGSDVYESRWSYDHKFHPTIHTTLNGEIIETPPIIQWDHLGVLKKPTKFSFNHDDPLISFKSLRTNVVVEWLGLNTHFNIVPTSRARSKFWSAWKSTPGFDGITARWLDEKLLRKEHLLRDYWSKRDSGDLAAAEKFLNENCDSVMAAVDLDNSISGWAPLAIKEADLYSFGQGGDANSRTRSKEPDFDNDGLQVLAVDSGTWPNEGGGVSACRRDMINNLRSVNWHMIAESANDFGLPKHQTEMNVRSLKVIPLWGLDFMTPTHGLFKDRLDTEVEHVPRDATKRDIERNFLPILTALVKGARTSTFTKDTILQTTRALVNLNTYFSDSKHWGAVWTSGAVKDAWRNLWLAQDLVIPTPSEGWFRTEIPSVAQLDAALELWYRYLFIFSIPVPERIPAIFQASHHSVSASYGIVCKVKRGCTLQIWDHAISWRETNLYLSSDLCSMAPFIRNSLLGLMRVTSQLILHHADTILPCADFFNPGWEVEIGTSQGALAHRNTFKRKIDPVVNGIPDMSKFAPIKEIKSKLPTVTMLSHVWYAKDIKTAILAADIIVNEWGFQDYRLDIYGAIDKAPSYSTDCFEIIASKSLPRFVTMCGEANPTTVLEKTWVFLNSSISEGLPLALGEAALTGAPVVCTDVGASLRVLTDQETGARYSSVVAPNDARNLARAQINFLALLDEWAPYANDPEGFIAPTLNDKPTAEDIAVITKRMYEKTEERKALGMRSREIVQKSFGGARYLREHEQMLWVGKARYDLLRSPSRSKRAGEALEPLPPIQSNVWGTTSIPSVSGRRAPTSSIQTASMMANSMEASTLMTPRVRSLFESGMSGGYRTSGSRASTLIPTSAVTQTPDKVKRYLPPRVAFLARSGKYVPSESSSLRIKHLPGEDTFVHDVTVALQSF